MANILFSLGRLDMANFGAALHSSGNLAIPSYGMLRKRPLFIPLKGEALEHNFSIKITNGKYLYLLFSIIILAFYWFYSQVISCPVASVL